MTTAAERHAALLEWFGRRQRDLPWRRTRDPWSVLVSELMLQQTQVARVLPKYGAFLERWPTAAACADAPLGEVVTAWAGLGYNRRAVNLHRCARDVVERHGGELPIDLTSLMALPGIGPYTARAVLAFAFESDEVGVLDTNAARVLARWSGRALGRAEAQSLADASVAPSAGWAWNQAMLDLGATVCVPRTPRCDDCPVAAWCAWHAAGCSDPDPAVGSAGVSTGQSRFDGSDRQGRGRLVDALRIAPVPVADLATVMGWPDDPDRAARVAATVVADGLATTDDTGTHRLP
ncbi:A/G-specific adenine glycosylase [Aquihabitans daechungensis]|uniref:A/G-specific adenine glycosylase n=1 Tax=Aquihabitans daechungensis TaxID=1052257 RepID=UPI003BA17B15